MISKLSMMMTKRLFGTRQKAEMMVLRMVMNWTMRRLK